MRMYSIYDSVAEEYSQPVSAKSDKVAVRMFMQQLGAASPEVRADYSLWFIGEFDVETAVFEGGDIHRVNLIEAHEGADDESV